jgi:hypothetical protein
MVLAVHNRLYFTDNHAQERGVRYYKSCCLGAFLKCLGIASKETYDGKVYYVNAKSLKSLKRSNITSITPAPAPTSSSPATPTPTPSPKELTLNRFFELFERDSSPATPTPTPSPKEHTLNRFFELFERDLL